MKRETMIWSGVIALGVILLIARMFIADRGFGKVYVEPTEKQFVQIEVDGQSKWVKFNADAVYDSEFAATSFESIPEDRRISWSQESAVNPKEYFAQQQSGQGGAMRLSLSRTAGLWIAAFFTLAIFSFLYKDNPLYKIAEGVVVGVSAAYWMVVGFWDVIVPNLIGKLTPGLVKSWAMPGLAGNDLKTDYFYLVPLILGVMLLWRLAPKGTWIARWPLAFIIGTTAGIRLVGFIHADFLSQIRNSIQTLIVMDGGFDVWDSIRNVILVLGVLCCLVYFFFSFEHKGAVGATARTGIFVLMITFGAAFGYTVMGRIALLAIRVEFLVDDWLWLIDPTGKRIVETTSLITPFLGG